MDHNIVHVHISENSQPSLKNIINKTHIKMNLMSFLVKQEADREGQYSGNQTCY